jgi:pyrrolidone-carboxylate peptidase
VLRGSRWVTAVVVTAMVSGLTTAFSGGLAMAADKDTGPVLFGSTPDRAVPTAPVDHARASAPRRYQAMASARTTDGSAPARSVAGPEVEFQCGVSIDRFVGGVGEDDFLEETVGVDWFAALQCNFFLSRIDAISGVIDRSESFNGESFDGRVIGLGTPDSRVEDFEAFSIGAIGVLARTYNGARRIEVAFEMFLLAPPGVIWTACNPIPGLRYLVCDGLGTEDLHVALGTGAFGTGLTRACRDQTAQVGVEERRLRQPAGTTPTSTVLLRRVPRLKEDVVDFKRALCQLSSAGDAATLADQRGLRLWQDAVSQAQAGVAAGDDRPLYWARVSMIHALQQWRPTFSVSALALETFVQRASRGMTTDSFTVAARRKIFVSGFDPFDFDGRGLSVGNASGASALRLDNLTADGVQVQAVLFPVCFRFFDDRFVESVFRRHLEPGPQQATFITTVSLGSGSNQFELEFYNGRRRSADVLDNCGQRGGGTFTAPVDPPNLEGDAQFITSTLPVHKMTRSSPIPAVVDTSVIEQASTGAPPVFRPDGPTPGSLSVAGSGGGFLSNEIAYRVTRLRDELARSQAIAVPAGHIHTPDHAGGDDGRRTTIVDELQAIVMGVNPIDSPAFLVHQHYIDFLERAPDPGGLAFWVDNIAPCRTDAACIDRKMADVSRAFWYSIEFNDRHPGLRNPPGVSPDFNNAMFIDLSYLTYLRRPADPGGRQFWLNELNRNNDYNHIIRAFLLSIEYRQRFGPA